MRPSSHKTWARYAAAASLVVLLAACQTQPKIRTQSAPDLNLARYKTYGYMEHPDTDKSAGYTTLTTRYIRDAVDREMQERGYTQAATNPDLLVNFNVMTKDKVEGTTRPNVGIGYGWGWRRGYAWNAGIYDTDVRTVTNGTLTVDLVDSVRKELVWSGSAAGRVTDKVLDNPQPTINEAVGLIFAKFPVPQTQAAAPRS